MKTLLHPTYFPNIATLATLVQHEVIWEVEDNYQKQTYRNRSVICTDTGRHFLSIPIKHVGGVQGRQKYKDVKLDNDYPWQRQHWRTLQTAYRTSPFFEYYENEIAPLYEQSYDFLMDFNFKTIEIIGDCLQIEIPKNKTSLFEKNLAEGILDARFLVRCKKEPLVAQDKYMQVFGDRHGFIKNTSILDLLFNEGTNAHTYLKEFNTAFLNA